MMIGVEDLKVMKNIGKSLKVYGLDLLEMGMMNVIRWWWILRWVMNRDTINQESVRRKNDGENGSKWVCFGDLDQRKDRRNMWTTSKKRTHWERDKIKMYKENGDEGNLEVDIRKPHV